MPCGFIVLKREDLAEFIKAREGLQYEYGYDAGQKASQTEDLKKRQGERAHAYEQGKRHQRDLHRSQERWDLINRPEGFEGHSPPTAHLYDLLKPRTSRMPQRFRKDKPGNSGRRASAAIVSDSEAHTQTGQESVGSMEPQSNNDHSTTAPTIVTRRSDMISQASQSNTTGSQ